MKPKKLVLSRKGFDSSAGGCPSPIFPDGTMYSLPIPGGTARSPVRYRDLYHGGTNIGQVIKDLTKGRWEGCDLPHLDPDLRPDAFPRREGWRGLFGQAGAAETHLERQGVGAGDLFLMFGLFRRVEETSPGWTFIRGEPQQHILWGWLQIEQIRRVDEIRNAPEFHWAHYHDHFGWRGDPSNTLYVAKKRLYSENAAAAPGAGVFPRRNDRLVLTEPGGPVSRWRLPRWFFPDGNRSPLTYHPDPNRWQRDDEYAYLKSVGRGQEFVLDLGEYPEATGWFAALVGDLGPETI